MRSAGPASAARATSIPRLRGPVPACGAYFRSCCCRPAQTSRDGTPCRPAAPAANDCGAADSGNAGIVRPWCVLLRGVQNAADGLAHAVIVGELCLELAATLRCELVEADFAIGLGNSPLGCDPSFEKHFLQRGIEEAFLDCKHLTGQHVNAL